MHGTVRQLRIKMTALVSVMVGAILLAVMVAGCLSAYQTQSELVENSLLTRLRMEADGKPQMGMHGTEPMEPLEAMTAMTAERRHSSLLTVLVISVSEDGTVLSADGWEIEVDTEAISVIVGRVMDGRESGYDMSYALAWESQGMGDGTTDIAVVDISSPVSAMARQLYVDVAVFLVSMGVMTALAWVLSGFATQPITEAWDTQRQFMSDASHELKTPLAVIVANMDVMGRSGSLTDDDMRWVESTKQEAGRMASLIADMLELSRADEAEGTGRAKVAADSPVIDLSELVEEVIMETDAMAFERGHALEDDIAQGVSVRGDAEKLGRAVRILIDNATKYGAEGTPVRVSLSSTKRHARVSVHNEGEPMSKEAMEHAFDRFYRSDKARTSDGTAAGSFGLGLSIAKSIAETHDGRISVESGEGVGTTFTITLRLPR